MFLKYSARVMPVYNLLNLKIIISIREYITRQNALRSGHIARCEYRAQYAHKDYYVCCDKRCLNDMDTRTYLRIDILLYPIGLSFRPDWNLSWFFRLGESAGDGRRIPDLQNPESIRDGIAGMTVYKRNPILGLCSNKIMGQYDRNLYE
jgi:hypothetical protein